MPETRTVRILDTDGKTYDVICTESSHVIQSSASGAVTLIRDRILGAAANQFTNDEASVIARVASIRIQEEGLFI